MNWDKLDKQMAVFTEKLIKDIKVTHGVANKLATTIEKEMRLLKADELNLFYSASPVNKKYRYEELIAFDGWMRYSSSFKGNPYVVRAQVAYLNYICFVYLPESCFKVLMKIAPEGSATRNCSKFMINNPIRAFRNAIAHSNWNYRDDHKAIIYWARKGDNIGEPLHRYEVEQEELDYWQHISRCVAYVAFSIAG